MRIWEEHKRILLGLSFLIVNSGVIENNIFPVLSDKSFIYVFLKKRDRKPIEKDEIFNPAEASLET